ncbi:serine/threonine-protein kinase [Haliangium sp.]|uniref:serine/threonine-protein kinase n=1 Tax=Haliangium sp. TaxID=2663208 RepID=UPI003D0D6628
MMDVRVGGYRIIERIAKGGMGEVYLARHEIMQREVAIKVLHASLLDKPDLVDRFLNEARAAATIRHPGIVEIFDVGYTERRAYIVMELLRGELLAERLARTNVDIDSAMLLIRQLAGAVGAAHACGIIHRDLKPENIFVVRDPDVPGGERTKILDFGIAKLLESQRGVHTATGILFGTPAYMAPEQCQDAATVDSRADIYSLGCIFYELLCGRPPFGHGGMELVAAHLCDPPPSLCSLAPEVPEGLEAVVLRLLAKDPDDRFQTCDSFIRTLDYVQAELISAQVGAVATGSFQALDDRPMGSDSVSFLAEVRTPHPHDHDDFSVADSRTPVHPRARSHYRPHESQSRPQRPSNPATSTTHSGSGQVQLGADPPSRRGSLLWIVLALVVVAAGGALTVGYFAVVPADTDISPPVEHFADADLEVLEHITEARHAVASRRWEDTLIHASRAIDLSAGRPDSKLRREAQSLRELAQEEQRNYYVYEYYQRALNERSLSAALVSYAELSGRSAYRKPAIERIAAAVEAWTPAQRAKAIASLPPNGCAELRKMAAVAERSAVAHADQVASLAGSCRGPGGDDTGRDAPGREDKAPPTPDGSDPNVGGDDSAARAPLPPAKETAMPDQVRERLIQRLQRCAQEGDVHGELTMHVMSAADGTIQETRIDHENDDFASCVRVLMPAKLALPRGRFIARLQFP